MAIPEYICVLWPSAAGSIPSGWSRVTDYDGRYLKGTAADTNPNDNGGSDTHTHGSSAHSSGTSHSHGSCTTGTVGATGGSGGHSCSHPNHTHTGTPSSGGPTSGTGSTSWGTGGTHGDRYTFIVIASDGSPAGYPDGCVAFFNGGAPTDWSQHSGSVNRYPVGAAGGADGGGTAAATGSHSHTTSSHTHTGAAHTHGGVTSSGAAGATSEQDDKGTDRAASGHTHTNMALGSGGSVTFGAATPSTNATSNVPPYHDLMGIENTSGGDVDTVDVIVFWQQSLGSIPTDFYHLCDGNNSTPDMRGVFVRMASSGGGSVGGTGGALGHTHSNPSHSHTRGSHTHGITTGNSSASHRDGGSGSATNGQPHTHTGTSPGNSSSISHSANTSSTADTQPPFRTVAFLKQHTATGSSASFPAGLGSRAAALG